MKRKRIGSLALLLVLTAAGLASAAASPDPETAKAALTPDEKAVTVSKSIDPLKKQLKRERLAQENGLECVGPWHDRFNFLLAPGYKLIAGDYANGVPDTLVYRLDKNLNLIADIAAKNDDGTVNAVIEIPAGTVAKWETNTENGRIFWELKNGKPRTISYLGYPGNYGSVPQTVAADGDPLDILCIGVQTDPASNLMELRGSVAQAKVIGVLYMDDGGDHDDKLIAVLPGTALFDANDLSDLDANNPNATFPGILNILETWFLNYKGPGEMTEYQPYGDSHAALQVLDAAILTYAQTKP